MFDNGIKVAEEAINAARLQARNGRLSNRQLVAARTFRTAQAHWLQHMQSVRLTGMGLASRDDLAKRATARRKLRCAIEHVLEVFM